MSDSISAEALGMTAGPPDADAVSKMSPSQVDVELAKFGVQTEAYAKLFSGDGAARKLFDALMDRKRNTDVAESLIAAASDPEAPQPFAGGMLRNGVSKRDEIVGVQDQLALGASLEEVAEFEIGEAMVSPADYKILEAQFNSQCLRNPQWVQKLLTGDPAARLTLDRWKRIMVTSRPLPPVPTTGIAR